VPRDPQTLHRCRALADVATTVRTPPRSSRFHPTRLDRAASPRRQRTPAQYPIGWIHLHRQRLPAGVQARQRKRRAIASDPQPELPGRRGVRPAPCRDVAATARALQTLPDRRLRVPSEHAACRLVSHRNAVRLGRYPRIPRRASPVPAASCETSLRTSDAGVDSRRVRRVATPVAEQHVTARRRRPSSAGSRLLRIETRVRRSPAAPGGLDADADTNRRLHNRRPNATVYPHDIETDGVATTVPAKASHEALGVR
jgi:hypothetical protein